MPRSALDKLKRKRVEVRAGGFLYRGILVEVTEEELTLRADTGFVAIPMERVTSVVDPSVPVNKAGNTFVDRSFYDADLPGETTSPMPKEPEKKDES